MVEINTQSGADALHSLASNVINTDNPSYTAGMFLEDFPQFTAMPTGILSTFISMAGGKIQADRWEESWRYAMGLYVAHYSTQYLKTYNPAATAEDTAAAGVAQGVIAAESLGDESVRYDNRVTSEATASWGDWNATVYGQQLASMGRIIGLGGAVI